MGWKDFLEKLTYGIRNFWISIYKIIYVLGIKTLNVKIQKNIVTFEIEKVSF